MAGEIHCWMTTNENSAEYKVSELVLKTSQILEPVASNLMPWSFFQARIGNILLVPSHLRKMYSFTPKVYCFGYFTYLFKNIPHAETKKSSHQ